MKKLTLAVLILSALLSFKNGVVLADEVGFLTLPLAYAEWPRKNGCLPITRYYDDETRNGTPFVYLGSEFNTAAMWCQDEKNHKYHLLMGKEGQTGYATDFSENKPCPLFILRDQAEPGDLSVSSQLSNSGSRKETNLEKSAYRGHDGKPRNGRYSVYELTSTTKGKSTTFICYQGEWLSKNGK